MPVWCILCEGQGAGVSAGTTGRQAGQLGILSCLILPLLGCKPSLPQGLLGTNMHVCVSAMGGGFF